MADKYTIADMQQLTVTDGVAVQLPVATDGVRTPESVLLQSLSTNTNPVFVKDKNDVAIDGSTGGHELPAGSNISLPLSGGNYREYYLISSSGDQKIQVTYLAGV